MTKISFNAQALGIANYHHGGYVGHAESFSPPVTLVSGDTSVEALFKVLGLANVKGFPRPAQGETAEDVDP